MIHHAISHRLTPEDLDLLTDFPVWFRNRFPSAGAVVVFDKDDTIISSSPEGRVLHRSLIKEVLIPLSTEKPKLCPVLYTLSGISALMKDYALFPEALDLFDLVITGDNLEEEKMAVLCEQGKLTGNPRALEWERILKPVDRIFAGYPVVLLDDLVGTCWSAIEEGRYGIRAYPLEEDSPQRARTVLEKIHHCLAEQLLISEHSKIIQHKE